MQLKGREKHQQLTAILVKSFAKPLGIEATDASVPELFLIILLLYSLFFQWTSLGSKNHHILQTNEVEKQTLRALQSRHLGGGISGTKFL